MDNIEQLLQQPLPPVSDNQFTERVLVNIRKNDVINSRLNSLLYSIIACLTAGMAYGVIANESFINWLSGFVPKSPSTIAQYSYTQINLGDILTQASQQPIFICAIVIAITFLAINSVENFVD